MRKAEYNEGIVYIVYISETQDYALVSKNEDGTGAFKVPIEELKIIN